MNFGVRDAPRTPGRSYEDFTINSPDTKKNFAPTQPSLARRENQPHILGLQIGHHFPRPPCWPSASVIFGRRPPPKQARGFGRRPRLFAISAIYHANRDVGVIIAALPSAQTLWPPRGNFTFDFRKNFGSTETTIETFTILLNFTVYYGFTITQLIMDIGDVSP